MLKRLFTPAAEPLPERIATFVEIASNNACNLSCVYCYGLGHPEPARLDREVYARLLDELLPRADVLVPSAGSEPFSADLELAADKVIRHGRRMLLITNGTHPMGGLLRRLAGHLYRLQISIDSHQPQLYERLRPGAKFPAVLANLREAVQVLRETGELHRLVVSLVLTRDNAGSIAESAGFFRNEGVEAFLVQELYRFDPRLDGYQPPPEAVALAREQLRELAHRERCDILFAHPPVQRFNGRPAGAQPVEWDPESVTARVREHPGRCWQASEWLKIHPGGEVHPCCVAPAELSLGNLARTPLAAILSNGRREALQRAFERGNPPEPCRRCPLLRQISTLPETA